MKVELRPGLTGRAEAIVDTTNVAAAMGSGDLDVFATPAMIALMEQAACNALVPCFDAATSSVGIKMDTTHDAATLPGKKVIATAELITVEGRKLIFKVGACDDHGPIGTGTHERKCGSFLLAGLALPAKVPSTNTTAMLPLKATDGHFWPSVALNADSIELPLLNDATVNAV